jgi:hypothetical protein
MANTDNQSPTFCRARIHNMKVPKQLLHDTSFHFSLLQINNNVCLSREIFAVFFLIKTDKRVISHGLRWEYGYWAERYPDLELSLDEFEIIYLSLLGLFAPTAIAPREVFTI